MKWKNFRPGIRLQLALSYTLISTVLIFSSAVALEITFSSLLATSFDSTLQMQAQQVAEGVSISQNKLSVNAIVRELPELDSTAALIDTNDSSEQDDSAQNTKILSKTYSETIIRIFDTKGHMLYALSTTYNLAIPVSSLSDPLHGKQWYGTLSTTDGQQFRLYSTMLVNSGVTYGIVQVGQSLTSVNNNMYNISLILLLLTVLALLLSAYGSYWLAGRTFEPIRHLTQIAHEISFKNMQQRVPVPAADDEVRELALIFNQMVDRLEHSFLQQRRFVADASHELRTPVSVIRSVSDVALVHASNPQEYVQVLKDINDESERLGLLITDLLALARADEGRVQFDFDTVQLDLLASDVVASMNALAAEHNISLTIEELQATEVRGDTARLIQVIMSLVENALQYTNAGGYVSLSVQKNDTHGLLIVHDNGIGIAPKDQKHVFERFYRADPARTRKAGGSGLGLAIVDWIVRAHDGYISVQSQLGQGTTFTVMLPLAKEEPFTTMA